jgi:hypothetical protein
MSCDIVNSVILAWASVHDPRLRIVTAFRQRLSAAQGFLDLTG